MSRKIVYTKSHVKKVHELMNNEKLTKKDAITKAGFSDSSLYYSALLRLGLIEQITLKEGISFI